ncbi:hypothetical protein C922_03306 [Plasmodium inui San Antonio 1]|uniref:Uncharacterized protein n=1 Tax=Plasmodium inui San Antonio 1 TaxID=1237626 RepID=W7A400_9APIC|nr:hypothetical protein C922_03306 [Plasmodium inui San Antonio 1]EUD66390.1 hypothetical protein C922_03306 [Plasmodium inui San Antonio 1]
MEYKPSKEIPTVSELPMNSARKIKNQPNRDKIIMMKVNDPTNSRTGKRIPPRKESQSPRVRCQQDQLQLRKPEFTSNFYRDDNCMDK